MKILFSGGGTGGHINPALAVAKHIRAEYPDAGILFAGAMGHMEENLVPREGFELKTFAIHGLRRSVKPKDISYNVRALYEAQKASREAKKVIRDFAPDVVMGTGGYASFPIVQAASVMGVPTVLLEVNAMPGFVTRKMSGKVDRILISYEETIPYLEKPEIAVVTGNPVRDDIKEADKALSRKKLGLGEKPLVVSFWGSLGAQNMNEHMIDFFRKETEEDRFYHIHAMGSRAAVWMPQKIRDAGIDLEAHPGLELREYIYDMDTVMSAADLVICRAGASTLSELCVLAKPSIIVPSPHVTDNHQEKNARALERNGACKVILEHECTGDLLYNEVCNMLSDPDRLERCAENARRQAIPDATDRITEELLAYCK